MGTFVEIFSNETKISQGNRLFFDCIVTSSSKEKLQNVKFGLDLTPRRRDLLSYPQTNVKNNPNIEFAFADINCRVGLNLN